MILYETLGNAEAREKRAEAHLKSNSHKVSKVLRKHAKEWAICLLDAKYPYSSVCLCVCACVCNWLLIHLKNLANSERPSCFEAYKWERK